MALANYSDLIAALSAWLNRTDLEATYTTFIPLFEARANRALRAVEMEASSTSSVTGESTALPTDCLALREVYSDSTTPLKSYAPQELRDRFRGYSAGTPLGYSVTGLNLNFAPTITSATDITLTYFQRIPSLTLAAPTNWLMTNYPDAYLYGVLAAAYDYLRDDQQAASMLGLSDRIFAEINANAIKRRLPAGPLVMRGASHNG